jgi:hypothetical protein
MAQPTTRLLAYAAPGAAMIGRGIGMVRDEARSRIAYHTLKSSCPNTHAVGGVRETTPQDNASEITAVRARTKVKLETASRLAISAGDHN